MPSGLDLEITESSSWRISKQYNANSGDPRPWASISPSRLGTGYSSLGYLARLPVNALKSTAHSLSDDGRFRQLDDSFDDHCARPLLNLKVIAEGVETEEHRVIEAAHVTKCKLSVQ